MRNFQNQCAQGDILISRVDSLPKNAVEVAAEGRNIIVTHSETGHHHVMEREHVKMYRLPDSIMDCLLVVEKPTALIHQRPHDTHEPIMFSEGIYHVRRQREYVPKGWRRVED